MSVAVPDLPGIPSRFGFAFSGNGRWATCLSTVQDQVTLERWDLARAVPSRRALGGGSTGAGGGGGCAGTGGDGREIVDRRSRPLPLDDGRVLVARAAAGERGEPEGHGTVIAAQADGADLAVTRSWPVSSMLAGYLMAAPGSPQVVVLVAVEDERHSRIWRLSDSAPAMEPVLRIPGVLSGGVWLDDGRTLALDHTDAGRQADSIVVDLRERTWRRVWSVAETTTDRIVAYSPRSRVLVLTTNSSGGRQAGAQRIGLWSPGGGPVRFPEALNRSAGARTPLTFDESGDRLLVGEVHGATSRLLVYTPDGDRIEPMPGPPGTLWPPASWRDDRIHLRFSAPDQPPTLATVRRPARSGWSLAARPPGAFSGWKGAELVELPGPAGPIEAVVYGGPRWRECRRLVMALHGGPLSAWRFEFDPLLQHLAAAGIAVVAPNYRGSTGYGERHLRAVIGDWGGPDLQDVVHLARAIARSRDDAAQPGPVLLGGSYGAFLALLAACLDPRLWSGCVALAPFTSASSLYRDAADPVRDRVARLNRLEDGGERHSQRDILRVCAALEAPLLLAHGTRDEVIPVEQSRALRRRLLELGRTEGAGFDYVEVDDDHTSVVQAWPSVLRKAVVRFCLTAERTLDSDQERR
ncbi:alpha/beta hydrolase family protein [Actinomadura rubrisoli]|uniref:Alpha/beta fold hydrolase n=1 Tax=Actinomadura rubrisoli TaxID=2530368 RepID=A0A4R5C6U3_9ACTN|nr:alpha/beta fold hydrolase [Actinomadura rubrisoli]TDD94795.1 alpha/beta fold hydrolase [Actinomadura rubrisoli]